MASYYEDDDASRVLIRKIMLSGGKTRQELIEELCRFKTESADEFFSEQSDENGELVPYIMMSRGEKLSNSCAKMLTEFVHSAAGGEMSKEEMANNAYFLMNLCLFKESDAMMSAYRETARYADDLHRAGIRWDESTILPEAQLPFVYQRRQKEIEESEEDAECDFFDRLSDTLILTAANAVSIDGKDETFTAKLKELYEDYPDVYTSAGFYAYFITDNHEAYDKFEKYTYDPADYRKLLNVLDGFYFENGKYMQGSPNAHSGESNKPVWFTLAIADPDIRWFKFLGEKSLADIRGSIVTDPLYVRGYLKIFSDRLYALINTANEESTEICRRYFEETAFIAGNTSDFAALRKLGVINDSDSLMQTALHLCENVCSGKCAYCFDDLFRAINDLPAKDVKQLSEIIGEYIRSHDTSAENGYLRRLITREHGYY